jgi:hypothetical protein
MLVAQGIKNLFTEVGDCHVPLESISRRSLDLLIDLIGCFEYCLGEIDQGDSLGTAPG